MADSPFLRAEGAAAPVALEQAGEDLLPRAVRRDDAAREHDQLVRDFQNPLLMGDDDERAARLAAQLLEDADEVLEAPQVNARLRLVKDGEPGLARHDHRDLDPLDLAARKARVHLAVDVVLRAEPHVAEIAAELLLAQGPPGGQLDEVAHRQPLEAHRLLEGEADAAPGALSDAEIGDVLPVKEDAPGGGAGDAGDDAGKGGFAAAVRPGDDDEFPAVDFEAHVPEDAAAVVHIHGDILQFQHVFTPVSVADVPEYFCYPSATSRIIMTRKPNMTPMVPTWECSPRCASGISSSTTT